MTIPVLSAGQAASPFHPGEQLVQTLAGVREEAETRGRRMLSADLKPQQQQFFGQLPFVLAAHVDTAGQPWAGLITGDPGFIGIDPARGHCTIDRDKAVNHTGVEARPGSHIGLLGIELATRRRNRLNGTVFGADNRRWRVRIDQGYGNCPQYIHARPWPAALFNRRYTLTEEPGLGRIARELATRTDTFFIATSSGPVDAVADTRTGAGGADISHRGGEPGFLRFDNGRLVFDDFPGNNMFNTLGNLASYPRCGILILDFDSGVIVQLAARGETAYDGDMRSTHLDVVSTRLWQPE